MHALHRAFSWLVCLALVASGCTTHTMQPLPGTMNFRFIVNNGVGEVIGRVRYTHLDATGPRTMPVAGATIDVLDGQGQPLTAIGSTTTNAQGVFRLGGFAIGQAYFVRARLKDATGAARELSAFVLPQTKLTCIELSLASTVVAQKIIRGEVPPDSLDPKQVDELVREVERRILEMLPPWTPGAEPPVEPPAFASPAPVPSPGAVAVPTSPFWDCPPDADGPFTWVPMPGGGGRWKVPSIACGCDYWWVPFPGGGGAWWRPDGDRPTGAWWRPGTGGAGGGWWAPPVGAPGADGRVWVPFPDGRDGCWWTPIGGPAVGVWLPGDGPGRPGHRYDGACGCWHGPSGWVKAPTAPGNYWNPPAADPGGFWTPPPGATGPCEWLPWPDGSGGTWCYPMPGGRRVFWVPRAEGGGYWWSPDDSGLTPGGWWIPPAAGRPGRWWTPPCPPLAGAGRVWVPFPGGSGGCWWVKPPGHCTCVWVPHPGREGGWWYLSDSRRGQWWHGGAWQQPGAGSRDVWAPPAPSTGNFWQLPSGLSGRPMWITTPDGGYWCIFPADSADPCFWIPFPGGGGYWWRAYPGSPGGRYWVPTPGGGTWWVAPATGDGRMILPNGSSVPLPVWSPGGAGGDCTCYWVPGPGGVGGHWFIPAPSGGGGSWWRPGAGGAGGTWWPAPAPNPAGPSASAPGGSGDYRWISSPGGGGHWWSPMPGGGPGHWWMPTAGGGGYWYTPRRGHCACYWIPLPGGGGYWWSPSATDPGGLWWWPDTGSWRAVPPTQPVGDRPIGPPGVAPVDTDLILILQQLTQGPLPAGPAGNALVFDRIGQGTPSLQATLNQATGTVLIANAIIQFKGVNAAPFPRKADPRYLLTGQVQLGCALDGASVQTLGFAMNGQLICEATWQDGAWKAVWNSRLKPDGEYFLTAHEIAPGHQLGKLLAKGYARVLNHAEDPGCDADWIADGPAPAPSPSLAPHDAADGHTH